MIKDEAVQAFLDRLASGAATPGGGSAAALLGASGAALLSMVCHLTLGKPGYEEVEQGLREALVSSEELRARLTALVDDDVRVFDALMRAYGLPRASDAQRTVRSATIQAALREAAQVPLACARACRAVIDLAADACVKGNRNVISDVGVAVLAAHAALRSAALNVHINAGAIKDERFKHETLAELEQLMRGAGQRTEAVHAQVKDAL